MTNILAVCRNVGMQPVVPSASMPRSYRLREPLRSNSTPLPRDKDLGTTAHGHLPQDSLTCFSFRTY